MNTERCSLIGCFRVPAAGSTRCTKHGDPTLTIVRFYPTEEDAGLRQDVLQEFGIASTIAQSFVEGHSEWEVAAALPLRPHLAAVINPEADDFNDHEPDEMTRGMSTLWDDD